MVIIRKKQKFGVFGGTFDPVHEGHLAVARGVLKQYRLDRIFFIPALNPPHKHRPLMDFSHRVAMLEAALNGDRKFSISLLEAERRSPSYTVDTLLDLHERVGDHAYYLIIGADSFMEINLWYRFDDLFKLADLVVAARPGISQQNIADQVTCLPGTFTYDGQRKRWQRDDGFQVLYYPDIDVPLSSSAIRDMLMRGEDVQNLLPPGVAEYIDQHRLYRTDLS